jgi:hypothetical protein
MDCGESEPDQTLSLADRLRLTLPNRTDHLGKLGFVYRCLPKRIASGTRRLLGGPDAGPIGGSAASPASEASISQPGLNRVELLSLVGHR